MEGDNEWIMAIANRMATEGEEAASVASCMDQLAYAHQRERHDDPLRQRHDVSSNVKDAVKPGPSALIR